VWTTFFDFAGAAYDIQVKTFISRVAGRQTGTLKRQMDHLLGRANIREHLQIQKLKDSR
jgi:hypothetical protein